jgi:hypothetical protein
MCVCVHVCVCAPAQSPERRPDLLTVLAMPVMRKAARAFVKG